MNSAIDAAARREMWNYALFTAETSDWDYGQWLISVLQDTFVAIEEFFGVEASSEPLLRLVLAAAQDEGKGEPHDWRHALELIGINALVAWPISECLRELGLFGRYGVTLEETPEDGREEYLDELLSHAVRFIEAFEIDSVAGKDSVIAKIVSLARSRRNLDLQKGEVDARSLAILGGVSEGRVRNMMSGASPELENVGGKVSAASALAWLSNRPDFFTSIWNHEEGENSLLAAPPMLDVVFVPEAQDGTRFHAGLKKNGHFQIGPKGDESVHQSFEDALEHLQRSGMEARWRRPNSRGNWGIVRVERWVPVDRASLAST